MSGLIDESKLFKTIQRYFNDYNWMEEAIQNAQRANADKITFKIISQSKKMIITNNGNICKNLVKMITIAGSDWNQTIQKNQDPAGMGIFSILSLGKTFSLISGNKILHNVNTAKLFSSNKYRETILNKNSDLHINVENKIDGMKIICEKIDIESIKSILKDRYDNKKQANIFIEIQIDEDIFAINAFKEFDIKQNNTNVLIPFKYEENDGILVFSRVAGSHEIRWYGQIVKARIHESMNLSIKNLQILFNIDSGNPLTPLLPNRSMFIKDDKMVKFEATICDTIVMWWIANRTRLLQSISLTSQTYSLNMLLRVQNFSNKYMEQVCWNDSTANEETDARLIEVYDTSKILDNKYSISSADAEPFIIAVSNRNIVQSAECTVKCTDVASGKVSTINGNMIHHVYRYILESDTYRNGKFIETNNINVFTNKVLEHYGESSVSILSSDFMFHSDCRKPLIIMDDDNNFVFIFHTSVSDDYNIIINAVDDYSKILEYFMTNGLVCYEDLNEYTISDAANGLKETIRSHFNVVSLGKISEALLLKGKFDTLTLTISDDKIIIVKDGILQSKRSLELY